MSAASKLLPPGLYHIVNVADDNVDTDGVLTGRLLDGTSIDGAFELAVVCIIIRAFQE